MNRVLKPIIVNIKNGIEEKIAKNPKLKVQEITGNNEEWKFNGRNWKGKRRNPLSRELRIDNSKLNEKI